MKLTIDKDRLVEQLTLAGRGVNTKGGGLFVLTGLHLRVSGEGAEAGLTVTGTDLDLTVQSHLETSVESSGEAVVPGRLLTDIVRSLPSGQVTLEAAEDEVQISSGRSQFSVRTLSTADFPKLPEPAGDPIIVASENLATAFRQVVRAASSDDARPILTGVLMSARDEGLRLVATDSYRLALRDMPEAKVLEADQEVLIPSRALEELGRMLVPAAEVTVCLGERDITFRIGPSEQYAQVTCRLISGDFPNYQPLIPDSEDNCLKIDRSELLEAARRLRLMARETSVPLRMELRPDGIELTVISPEIGRAHEELDASYEGEAQTVAFNPDYLIEGLEAAGEGRGADDETSVELVRLDPQKPAVLRADGQEGFLYLLMPVRVS